NLEDICKNLGLPTEGVKTKLIQRLKTHSNLLTIPNRNLNLSNIRENEACKDNTVSDIDQHKTNLKADKNVIINNLREQI
ncbi:28298_t:CDS:1, partial [Racocetra persica]